MLFYQLKLAADLLGKLWAFRSTHQVIDTCKRLIFLGKNMGLFIVDHLDAVFNLAQVAVGFFHFNRSGFVNPATVGQPFQGDERTSITQLRITATSDKLLGLRKELNFTYTTAA